ncbi:protein kinase [Streptomyces sp. GbtcB7]|uniref:protein kinase domain-containing protein n=1 Tax=Streptomyces sp. GbtcB7 TaxID=2824752 RepID=UPI001C30216F|nr:protein kinase [Streptomyces sp. GbtcB7]
MTFKRLATGTVLRTLSSTECRIDEHIAGGGEGEVYAGDLNGNAVAVKWYNPASATLRQWHSLEQLLEKGAPNARFVWPLALVSRSGSPPPDGEPFGYIMPLIDRTRFRSLADLLARRIKPRLSVLATAGFQLADSYRQLHSCGLAYRDVSRNNVMFDPATGDIVVCDNDHVSTDGHPSDIWGTPAYVAPEIILETASPSRETDLWSLAVLLFHLYINDHPLRGRAEMDIHCLDPAALRRLCGERPVFIYDPHDDSNRPVPGEHDAAIALWPLYPRFLRDLFTQAFTTGIRDPHARVGESQWQQALAQLRDCVLPCPNCGRENFYDVHSTPPSGTCLACGLSMSAPGRLRLGPGAPIVVLTPDTKLYPHHLDPSRRYDFSTVLAELYENPARKGQWGLKNLGDQLWTFTGSDGIQRDVAPGRTVPLEDGRKINFGRVAGDLRT